MTLGGSQASLFDRISQSGWDIEVVGSLFSAAKKYFPCNYSTGLLVVEKFSDCLCAEMEFFLSRYSSIEWVGVFSAEFLSFRKSHEFIIKHCFDFHTLPVDSDKLLHTLGHAHGICQMRKTLHAADTDVTSDSIVGRSPASQKLYRDIKKIAAVDATVMISGASGSGKELAAQTIHRLSKRTDAPFVAVNCSALPASLIQSELFGYERGAFSGAQQVKKGFIEAAAGGTIFLDEIGDMPLDLQSNLLRFLQEKSINRIGSTRLIHVDTRVIAASHINLEEAVATQRFRADLFYRLCVLTLAVPLLRERPEDIVLLAEHFYTAYKAERNPRIKGFSASAIAAMQAYSWPGNVRELLNRIRRALVMAEGRLITCRDLGLAPTEIDGQLALIDARASAERSAIQQSLSNSGNNLTRAARELGVSRMTLYRLLEKHQITLQRIMDI